VLEGEQAQRALLCRRQELLVAVDMLADVDKLPARRAAPMLVVALDEVDPAFAALGKDLAADLAVGGDLGMVIVRIAAAQADLLEGAAQRDFGARVVARLVDVDVGALGFDRRVERKALGDAIECGVAGDRGADVERAIDVGERARALERAAVAVGQIALQVGERANVGVGAGRGLAAERLGEDETAGAQVVVFGPVEVAMRDEMAAKRDIDLAIGEPFVGGGGIAKDALRRDAAHRDAARDARVDDVDHPADRRRSEQQGGRGNDISSRRCARPAGGAAARCNRTGIRPTWAPQMLDAPWSRTADLGAAVLDGIDPAAIEDVIVGCVSQVGEQSFHIGRNMVLASSLPDSVPAVTIDRQCGSSQQALHFAAQAVMSGTQDVVIAAGVESMTRVPMGTPTILPMQAGIGIGPWPQRSRTATASPSSASSPAPR
jgi:hypothetical protein